MFTPLTPCAFAEHSSVLVFKNSLFPNTVRPNVRQRVVTRVRMVTLIEPSVTVVTEVLMLSRTTLTPLMERQVSRCPTLRLRRVKVMLRIDETVLKITITRFY